MSMRYVVVACLAMLAGCTTAKDVYLPDGTPGYHVSCNAFGGSSADCYQKAGEICGARGYTIVNVPGGMFSTWDLFIKCKD
jgi:hypothetical protein